MDSVYYYSGDDELKNHIGQFIALNTIPCNDYKFNYSANIIAKRISDSSTIIITNFPAVVNGATTSGDYLSIFTTNY